MDSPVLVTGATGFVLSHVVEHLSGGGAEVVAVDIVPPQVPVVARWKSGGRRITFVRADVRDASAMEEILTRYRVATVVHGAVIIPDPSLELLDTRPVLEVGVAGTAVVLRASLAASVGRLVYVSSASVYAPIENESVVLGESAPTRASGLYPLIKLTGEWLTREAARTGNLQTVVARLAAAYGPLERDTGARTDMSPVWHAVRLARTGEPIILERPEHTLDFTHASDLAAGIRLLVHSKTLGHATYNIGSGEAVSCRLVAQSAIAAIGAGRLIESNWHQANVSMRRGSRHGSLDISRIRDELGYTPAFDIREGIIDYVRWLHDHEF